MLILPFQKFHSVFNHHYVRKLYHSSRHGICASKSKYWALVNLKYRLPSYLKEIKWQLFYLVFEQHAIIVQVWLRAWIRKLTLICKVDLALTYNLVVGITYTESFYNRKQICYAKITNNDQSTFPRSSSPDGRDTTKGGAILPEGNTSDKAPFVAFSITYSLLIPKQIFSPHQDIDLTVSGTPNSFTSTNPRPPSQVVESKSDNIVQQGILIYIWAREPKMKISWGEKGKWCFVWLLIIKDVQRIHIIPFSRNKNFKRNPVLTAP